MDLISNLLRCMFIGCTRYKISLNWVAISAIGTFFVVVVALIPIIIKAFHGFKTRKVLKDLIYVDVRDLNESFQGKLNTYQDKWETNPDWTAPIPKYDFSTFENLVSNYKESIYMSRKERMSIGKLIRTFKKETYHNDFRIGIDYEHQYTYKVISKKGIEEIVNQTKILLNNFEENEKGGKEHINI